MSYPSWKRIWFTSNKPMWTTTSRGKFLKTQEYQTTWPASWEICIQVKKQQLELDMEQWTGSKLGKKYIKAVYYCHLFLISSASVRSIPFLSFIEPMFALNVSLVFLIFLKRSLVFDCVDHNKLWKILQEMGIPDHLTCLLGNLYEGQESTVRSGHGTTAWFQIWKGVPQGCRLSLCLFNIYAEYTKRNARLDGCSSSWNQDCWEKYKKISDTHMKPPLWQKARKN